MNKNILSRVLGALGLVLILSTAVTIFFGNTKFIGAKAGLGIIAVVVSFVLGESGGLKRFFAGRAAYFGLFTGISAVVVLAILVTANFVAYRKPKSWDLTKNRIFTLSEDTEKTVRGLASDVKIIAFYRQDEPAYRELDELLKRYATLSTKLKYEFIDPYKSPEIVKHYTITDNGPRIVIVKDQHDVKVKDPNEQGLTNGLVKVTHDFARKIYVIDGHGEPDPTDESTQKGYGFAMKSLKADGYQVEKLSLLQSAEIPMDAALVLVVTPKKAFLSPEVDALKAYAKLGGKVGIFLEPEIESGLEPLLKDWGIEADNDMVVDKNPVARLFGGSPVTPVLQQYAEHAITKNLPAVVFPTTRLLVGLTGAPVTPLALVLTGPESWGETDIQSLFTKGAKQDPGEKRGPMPVAMLATKSTAGEKDKRSDEARVMVFGDGEFFSNQYQHLLGNLDLFLNSANWLAAQDDRITIRAKARDATRIFLTDAQVSGIKFLTIDAFPVALLGLGLAVWLVRRSK